MVVVVEVGEVVCVCVSVYGVISTCVCMFLYDINVV